GQVEGQTQLWDTGPLRERLKNPVLEEKRLKQLIADLDHKDFAVRQKASTTLATQGDAAEKALKDVLAKKPALEVARRIEEILEKLKQGPPAPGTVVQTLRAGERCIESMAFTKDGQMLAASDRDGIRFWNTKTGTALPKLACPYGG